MNVCINNDVFSNFSIVVLTKDQKASTAVKVLVERWCLYFSIPQRLHSYKGEEFAGDIISELCKTHNIEKSKTDCNSRGDEKIE